MAMIILNGKKEPMTAPKQLNQFVKDHPAQIRRFIYMDELKAGFEALKSEWTAAAEAHPDPEMPEFVRLLLVDVAELLGLE
jgi:hypothetical protein